MNKTNNKKIFYFLISLSIFSILLISLSFSAHIIKFNDETTLKEINESSSYKFILNISVNNTDEGEDANITEINITLPNTNFSFISLTNGTNSAGTEFTLINEQTVRWAGNSLVGTNKLNYFWINITAGQLGLFNITIKTTNSTITEVSNISINVTDHSAPTTEETIIIYNNSVGIVPLNISVEDVGLAGISIVAFNITNTTNYQLDFFKTTNNGDYYSNITGFNISGYNEGVYKIKLWANDSYNNVLDNLEVGNITIDRTPPAVTFEYVNKTKTTIRFKIILNDSLSGINSSCSVGAGSIVVSGEGTEQTVDINGLTCGTGYSYTVSCYDRAGNLNNSESYSFTTVSCSSTSDSSSSGGSSSTSSYWKNTYSASKEQIINGYTKELSLKERIKTTINNEEHSIGVIELRASSIRIAIFSLYQEMEIGVGEIKKVDINFDGYYDLLVQLNGIKNDLASLTIRQIFEPVEESKENLVEENQTEPYNSPDFNEEQDKVDYSAPIEPSTEKKIDWFWPSLSILIIVILVLLIIWYYKSKRKF